jgi:hypothetical protein
MALWNIGITAIWYIFSNLVCIFPILVYCVEKNLATLSVSAVELEPRKCNSILTGDRGTGYLSRRSKNGFRHQVLFGLVEN